MSNELDMQALRAEFRRQELSLTNFESLVAQLLLEILETLIDLKFQRINQSVVVPPGRFG